MFNAVKEEKELLTLIEVAEVLGLDYFHARKVLINSTIGYYQYGRKRLWNRLEVLDFKEKHHHIKPTENE